MKAKQIGKNLRELYRKCGGKDDDIFVNELAEVLHTISCTEVKHKIDQRRASSDDRLFAIYREQRNRWVAVVKAANPPGEDPIVTREMFDVAVYAYIPEIKEAYQEHVLGRGHQSIH